MKEIRKLPSKVYDKVIEVRVPVRFYWDKDGFDGFEFGSLENCSRYQLRLLNKVIDQLSNEHDYAIVGEYLRENYPEDWKGLMNKIEAETLDIPQAFFDAFKTKDC